MLFSVCYAYNVRNLLSKVSKKVKRPENLPDYTDPPLSEVVLGVQFQPPVGYQQIYAHEVWHLYSDDFPTVQEMPPLQPSFETFGISSFTVMPPFNFVTNAMHNRFWFVNQNADELIQFQNDRLLHNWRKVTSVNRPYPRFEVMCKKLKEELNLLQNYFNTLTSQSLNINQCEISYINDLYIDENSSFNSWFEFADLSSEPIEDFNFTFRELVKNEKKEPVGRLTVEVLTAINAESKRFVRFTLTVRGVPEANTIDSAEKFLTDGRSIIVNKFTELTSKNAHKIWGRLK